VTFHRGVLYAYTDGSCLHSPRRGGIGVRLIYVDEYGAEQVQDIQSPGYRNATNNQMELKACIFALEEAHRLCLTAGVTRIIIRTDSRYVVDNYKKAMFQWPNTRWYRQCGAPVLNTELWKQLTKSMKKTGVRVDIEWVKGHSKDEHNRAADRMARVSADKAVNAPLSLVHARRKLSEESVCPGSVEMRGQRISIRIVTTEYLRPHKLWKHKYEVISKRSPYYMLVDIIYSDQLLEPGHSYYLRVNDQTDNPRVVKVFRELHGE
jgi:ribonuclease HI